jgi:hypothetical protein
MVVQQSQHFLVHGGMAMSQKLESEYQNVVNDEFQAFRFVVESCDLQLKLILQVVDIDVVF